MRVAVVLAVVGSAGFVVSGVWFVVELAHMASEPAVPHDHFPAVVAGFILSMVLLGGSLTVLLEARAAHRREAGRSARRWPI